MINRFDKCGGYFSTRNGTITSPSYPGNYPSNADCIYTIAQPTGTVIMLNFLSMDIESHDCDYDYYDYCDPCSYDYIGTPSGDYLEIRDGPSSDSPLLGEKLCGNEIPSSIQSSQNKLWIR